MGEPDTRLPLEVTLDDGTRLRLRLGTPADREALAVGFDRLSPASRVHRFFTAMPHLAPHFLDRLVDVDADRHVAISAHDLGQPAEVGDPADGLGVGVARYLVDADDPSRAEAAVAVVDAYQERGIGRLLLEALVAYAASRGVRTFTAHVRADNEAMRRLLTELGAEPHTDPEERAVL
ncbi:MAG: GNAT family N-acetyltransferase, partial [Myxococcota bacterium]|nr:GNAT family N-acetyltransferase [Myxococcota bacterium]